jgi:hypothetical protein
MPKLPDNLDDYSDAAEALIEWFKSQDISEAKSVAVMSYLIGVIAAAGAGKDVKKAMSMLDTTNTASRGICLAAILMGRD